MGQDFLVPGEKVTLVDGRNSKVTVTTNKAGVGSATFGTLDRAAKVSAAATLPATAVTYAIPSNKKAQRVFVSGAKTTVSARDTASFPPPPPAKPPKIGTTALDKADGDHMVVAKGGAIVDTVAYHDAIPGKPYKVVGEMMDQVTGKPTGIKVSAKFTAKAESGTAKVVFTVPTGYAGKDLVAFETISMVGHIVGSHQDTNADSQTVSVSKPTPNPTPTPTPTPTPAVVAPTPTPTPTPAGGNASGGGIHTGDVPGGPVVGWIAGGVVLMAFAGGVLALVAGGRRNDPHGE